ncbi:unnamed protein product [Parascedosporium putredinis]|uniref:NodB homology domain-containing protein n=1 Tax=Parascedosporium putredinis TaxID=1442378 RepID=A0A9P1GWT6_9PEZI|nr:unnamed protein product [Parascedosporium putredinis]CAI7988454.1 unnamed protein product [Parascedosporium putredinis]
MLRFRAAATALALASTVAGKLPSVNAVSTEASLELPKRDAGWSCGPGVGTCGEGCQLAHGPACDGNLTPDGPDTSSLSRTKFGKVPYGVNVDKCTTPGTMALSFDDGPYHYTTELLDLLKDNNAVATFYVTGINGAKGAINDPSTGYPAILRRMLAEGHQIGSHSWSHENMEAVGSSGATLDRTVQSVNQDKAVQPGAGSGKITKIHAPGGPGGDRAASNSDHDDDDGSPRGESAAAKGFHVHSWIHILPLLPSLVACFV